MLVNPMAAHGTEPIGSMGTDIPLAVLSEAPQLLSDYFKQLFAQVTNPPVDADREAIVMAVDTAIGPEGNLLEPTPEAALHFELPTPVLLNVELEKIRALDGGPGLARLPVDLAPDALQGAATAGRGSGRRSRTCGGGAARRSPRGTTS